MKKLFIVVIALVAAINLFFVNLKKDNGKLSLTTIDAWACWPDSDDSGVSGSGSGSGSGGFVEMAEAEVGETYYKPDASGSGGHSTYDITWHYLGEDGDDDDENYGYIEVPYICPNQPLHPTLTIQSMQNTQNSSGGAYAFSPAGPNGSVSISSTNSAGQVVTTTYNDFNAGSNCKFAQSTEKYCTARGC